MATDARVGALDRMPMRRMDVTAQHVIIAPGPNSPGDFADQLRARGATLVRAVPDDGFVALVNNDFDPSDLHPRIMRPMNARERVSADLELAFASQATQAVIVEFHPDVAAHTAHLIAGRAGARIRENPDLIPGQFLMQATTAQILGLASWDEVAYIFPASDDLVRGLPVRPCAGAITASGTVGQYIPTVGDGWDGPGQGHASLTYSFGALTAKVPADLLTATIQKAMAEWASHIDVTFTAGTVTTAARNLNFLFASGAHGDAYPFDGPGKVLAHTYYPAPPNSEPIAGDLHFDNDENWNVGADIDVYSVVLHELGHALGLGHADKPGAVMYPYYSRVTQLTADDINAAMLLYAATPIPGALTLSITSPPASTTASTVDLKGTATGGIGAVQVTWQMGPYSGIATGSRSWTIVGIPMFTGPNTVTITATDSPGATKSALVSITRLASVPPVLAIVPMPPTSVSQASITFRGTASQASGIASVKWTNSAGGSGTATGTTNWSISLMLVSGPNTISVTATAVDGSQTTVPVAITYTPPTPTGSGTGGTPNPGSGGTGSTSGSGSGSGGSQDVTPPAITITSPTASSVSTTATTIRLAGAARDNVGVVAITWSTSTGYSGTATGTTSWSIASIPLLVGDNTITVRAKDAAGNVAWRSLLVSRR